MGRGGSGPDSVIKAVSPDDIPCFSGKEIVLLEAKYLLDQTNPLVREYLTGDIEDFNIKPHWDYANTLKPRQFEEQFSSTINRMIEFLSSPIIRNTIGQVDNCLDLKKVMDEGIILLVNLIGRGPDFR